MSPQSARKYLKDNKVKYILAQFVDIHGAAKAKAVPVEHLDMMLNEGAGFAGFALWGFGTVIEHLRDEGFDPSELAKIHTPIGLNIGAETPEEIAISIMAEVVMQRRGGTGATMYHRPARLRDIRAD